MKICVYGLWHLGTVTAACLASAGHDVVGLDESGETIDALRAGRAPLFEPGLDDLLQAGIDSGKLTFETDAARALSGANVLWVTYDTPVDDEDVADVEFVTSRVEALARIVDAGTLVIMSSQLPVGTSRGLERRVGRGDISFAALPENLRLGKAIEIFRNPDRVVAGVRSARDRERVAAIFAPMTDRLEWMSVESAEMTKHAINAFLAMSVAFANEIATICEAVGADAKEVERGLKTESRIGPRAYVGPGSAFAGGTLARDIAFLTSLGEQNKFRPAVVAAVKTSNDAHRQWVRRKLRSAIGDVRGRAVAILGLTYKAGTDTLRRSSSVELCRWLANEGAEVRAFDPAVRALPGDVPARLCTSAAEAAAGASAVVIGTEWPDFQKLAVNDLNDAAKPLTIIDPNRFLRDAFDNVDGVRYLTIGKGAA